MENTILYIITAILVIDFIFERALDFLNRSKWSPDLPKEAEGIYDPGKYRRSQEYLRVNSNFSLLTSSLGFIAMLVMLYAGGFAMIDDLVRSYTSHPVVMALLYFGILGAGAGLLGLPFSLYRTFVIEERFGFNRTTFKTWFRDLVLGLLLSVVIGGGVVTAIVYIWLYTGEQFWLWAWGALALFSLIGTIVFPTLIFPLFNKFTPLPQGELRDAIENYCRKVNFRLDNIYTIDGSKRSTKANAFFTGLGPVKRIVLYDTLIEKHTTEELVAVLAHEVGHYKKKHIPVFMLLSILQTGIMLFILSYFLDNPALARALGAEQPSFHLNIIAFAMLYSPLSAILGVFLNALSRKNEFEADHYAAVTYTAAPLQSALKKLSVDSLSNLRPHPAYVFVHYSHPPLLQRLAALNAVKNESSAK